MSDEHAYFDAGPWIRLDAPDENDERHVFDGRQYFVLVSPVRSPSLDRVMRIIEARVALDGADWSRVMPKRPSLVVAVGAVLWRIGWLVGRVFGGR